MTTMRLTTGPGCVVVYDEDGNISSTHEVTVANWSELPDAKIGTMTLPISGATYGAPILPLTVTFERAQVARSIWRLFGLPEYRTDGHLLERSRKRRRGR